MSWLSKTLERYLFLWLVALSALAFAWPRVTELLPGLNGVGDPFLGTSSGMMSVLIALTMFAIGWMLPRDEVRQVASHWRTVLGGTCVQFAAMPLLAYSMGHLFGLGGDDFVGMVMVGCVPGAMASNVLTLNARGNTSYSVSLTATATLLSPLIVPLVLGLALATAKDVTIPFGKTSGMLLVTVVGPVVTGHLFSRRFPNFEGQARLCGSVVANVAILWIIAAVVGKNREPLSVFRGDVLAALLTINAGGYAAGYLGGSTMRLLTGMRRALTLEVGMQNAGLGATLATQLFPDRPAVAIAPALYTFGCMVTGVILARIWAFQSERASRDDSTEMMESTDPDRT